jgi:hypothetical protein
MKVLAHVTRAPLWALVAIPGHLGEPKPEIAEARRALASSDLAAKAIEAVLVRRALIAAASAASAPDQRLAERANAQYEVLAELLMNLFEPNTTTTSTPVDN